ncbi:MFS transporter [Glycomyces harbinensis]|uniref:Predicted arabinose efflux permease, MFS family n=1 Tax=Glycomyces harbinensis TaxID=58114 RepID=A0A1G7B219_9ACTN|nr:MFS transporter [Glycomyces harbinensis]SDE21158.1 Predicted arabinose efflux permease, MFS family [Glycomyces harbinensis]
MKAREWGVLLVLSGAIFLEGIDVAMLNIALPSIRTDLGLSTGSLQWVVSAYVLGYGGFMLLGGRAADILGRRRVFLAALLVFLLFSGLGGFAEDGATLIAARFVTGLAAAFMTPAGLSIITTGFDEGPKRDRALMVYGAIGAGGFTLGMVIGGLLTSLDWRWVFFMPVGLSLVILVAAALLIPKSPRPVRDGRRFDLFGGLTITAAVVLLVLGVERAAHVAVGWTVGIVAVSVALIAVFVAVERRHPAPLVRLGIFRSGSLVRANLIGMLFMAGFFGFQFLVVLYLQELRGWSTIEASLAMLVIGIDVALAPTVTPKLVRRFGNAPVLLAGLVSAALGFALFLSAGMDSSYGELLPSLVLMGLAFTLAYGPLTIIATNGIDEAEQGLAGGLLYTSFQFGAAIGLAGVAAVNVAATGSDAPQALLDGYRAAMLVPIGAAVVAVVVGAFNLGRKKHDAVEKEGEPVLAGVA